MEKPKPKVEVRPLFDMEEQWRIVRNLARNTVGKAQINTPVSMKFKREILLAEHSPIRALQFVVVMDVPYYVSVHLVRHKHGVEHYVSTSREDRTGVSRDERRQTDFVRHTMLVNAQALIQMARKRLCMMADETTRETMYKITSQVLDIEPAFSGVLIPECRARGGRCPEFAGCGICRYMGD